MSELITPAGILRLVEAIPETADNFPILRELLHAAKDLVAIAAADKDTK